MIAENRKNIVCLLSISELTEGKNAENLTHRALEKLDSERRKKAEYLKNTLSKSQSIGAGLLLQWGAQMWEAQTCEAIGDALQVLTIEHLLKTLAFPFELTYIYGADGKPAWKDIPLQFSLSHSGEYVLCAFSETTVGADLQKRKPLIGNALVKRYFTEKEQTLLEQCKSGDEREALFYTLWTRKEAYGKLTGKGIADTVKMDFTQIYQGAFGEIYEWEEYEQPSGYHITICRKKS